MDVPFREVRSLDIAAKAIEISIPIHGKLSVITGNSGTGKSYICNIIRSIKAMPSSLTHSTIPLDSIKVWRSSSDVDTSVTNSVVIIDKYPLYDNIDELKSFIVNSRNKIIIMTHGTFRNIPMASFNMCKVKSEDGGRKLRVVDLYK
jgi:hypothetical protein